MPTDHKNIFEVQNPNTWILLKAKSKVWPVHVINNRMEEGWDEFYHDTHLEEGFSIIFGLQRLQLDTWPVNSDLIDTNPPSGYHSFAFK